MNAGRVAHIGRDRYTFWATRPSWLGRLVLRSLGALLRLLGGSMSRAAWVLGFPLLLPLAFVAAAAASCDDEVVKFPNEGAGGGTGGEHASGGSSDGGSTTTGGHGGDGPFDCAECTAPESICVDGAD